MSGDINYIKDSGPAYGGAPIFTATGPAKLELRLYTPKRSGRTPNATWRVSKIIGNVTIAEGTWSQNGAPANNAWTSVPEMYVTDAGDYRLDIGNGAGDADHFLAIDAAAIKVTPTAPPGAIALVTPNGVLQAFDANGSTLASVGVPDGKAAGQLAVVVVHGVQNSAVTWGAGLTPIGSYVATSGSPGSMSLAYKVLDGAETAFTGTLSVSSRWATQCFLLTGGNTLSPIHVAAAFIRSLSTVAPVTPAMTTTIDGAAVLQITSIRAALAELANCTGIASDNLDATTIAANITARPFSLVSMEVLPTAGVATGATHSYEGTLSLTDGITCALAIAPANVVSTSPIDFPTQATWPVPGLTVVKNTGEITIPVATLAPVTGGVGTLTPEVGVGAGGGGCSVRVVGTEVRFTPNHGFSGTARFWCVFRDSFNPPSYSDYRTVDVDVTNTPPVASNRTSGNKLTVEAGTVTRFSTAQWVTDQNGDTTTVILTTLASGNLTAAIDGDEIVITATTATDGEYTLLRYKGNDGTIDSNIAEIHVTVLASGGNTPTLSPGSMAVFGNPQFDGYYINVLDNASNPGGLQVYPDTVNGANMRAPGDGPVATANGTVHNDEGSWIYYPNTGFVGIDTLSLTVWNGTTPSLAANWYITVLGLVYDSLTKTYAVTLADGQYAQAQLNVASDLDVFAVAGAIAWSVFIQPESGEVSVNSNGLVTFSHAYGPGRTVTAVIRAVLGNETRDFTLTITSSRTLTSIVSRAAGRLSRALDRML